MSLASVLKSLYAESSPQTALLSRKARIVVPLFPESSCQLERFSGEESVLGRRIGLDDDLRNGTLTLS